LRRGYRRACAPAPMAALGRPPRSPVADSVTGSCWRGMCRSLKSVFRAQRVRKRSGGFGSGARLSRSNVVGAAAPPPFALRCETHGVRDVASVGARSHRTAARIIPWVIDERSEESGASSALAAPPFGGSGALPPQAANVRQRVRSHWRLKEKITCGVRSRCRGNRSHCRRRHCRKSDKQRPRVFGLHL